MSVHTATRHTPLGPTLARDRLYTWASFRGIILHAQGWDTPDLALARISAELRPPAVSEGSAPPGAAAAVAELPDPQESAAIRRVQAGDAEAFDPIVRRYLRTAYTVAFRVVGHREDAEDVVQEAFLAALANIESFDTSRRFGPWLYRIVMTRGLNFRKSRSRRAAEPLDDAGLASNDASPAAAAEQAGLKATVATALSRLPERQRMVVQLFELDGFSGAEIAKMLGVSPGTVRWYLHEARQSLRRMLAHLQETAE